MCFERSPLERSAPYPFGAYAPRFNWDKTGGNDDRLHVQPGETVVLAGDIAGAKKA